MKTNKIVPKTDYDYLDKEEIETLVNALLQAHSSKIKAQYDAAACQTDRDFERARKKEDAFYESKDECIQKLLQMIKK